MSDKRTIENNITTITLNGIEYSAVNIGPEASGIPMHILQSERQSGIIIDGETITPFYWRGVTKDSKYQYAYFDKTNLEPLETITTNNRANALKLINELAFGINSATPTFLDMATGIFPLHRVYILDGTKIVILPPDMGSLISISQIGNKDLSYLKKKNCENGFTLISEMAQLMYWSASGRLPYENKDVRVCDYTEVPLEWYEDKLDEKTLGFINFILHCKESQMRDISGNRKPHENLSWFLNRVNELNWNLGNRDTEEREEVIQKAESDDRLKHYFTKIEAKAKKRNFWRVKGTLIISFAVVVAIIGTIAGTALKAKFEAPYTKNMDKIEIVDDFFNNMNNLDPTNLENNAFKVSAPQYNAVIGLFVNKQTRAAYETINPSIYLPKWLEDGKPAIPETSFIYGADIKEISEIDENVVRASGIWYTPYRESDDLEIEAPEGYTVVYKYDVDEDFYFSWSKRGWWVVNNIEISKYEYIGYELVETYKTKSGIEKLMQSN